MQEGARGWPAEMCLPEIPVVLDVYGCPSCCVMLADLTVVHTPCHSTDSKYHIDWSAWLELRTAEGDFVNIINEQEIAEALASVSSQLRLVNLLERLISSPTIELSGASPIVCLALLTLTSLLLKQKLLQW